MLSIEKYREIAKKSNNHMAEMHKKYENIKREELAQKGITMIEKQDDDKFHGDCDSVYTMEKGSATLLYIIVMVAGVIFVDRWLIWIAATLVWLGYKFRHKIKK